MLVQILKNLYENITYAKIVAFAVVLIIVMIFIIIIDYANKDYYWVFFVAAFLASFTANSFFILFFEKNLKNLN